MLRRGACRGGGVYCTLRGSTHVPIRVGEVLSPTQRQRPSPTNQHFRQQVSAAWSTSSQITSPSRGLPRPTLTSVRSIRSRQRRHGRRRRRHRRPFPSDVCCRSMGWSSVAGCRVSCERPMSSSIIGKTTTGEEFEKREGGRLRRRRTISSVRRCVKTHRGCHRGG